MERYFGEPREPFHNAAVAIGNFDGVHLGHRQLIQKTIELSKKMHGTSVVYTFDPHPAKILAPDRCLPLIQTLDQRLSSIEELKVNACVIAKFTHEFAKQTPEHFCKNTLVKKLGAKAVVVGYDFTFGFHRSGGIDLLEKICSKLAVKTFVLEAKFIKETLLSSTEIRNLVSSGMVDKAIGMLGRPYRLEGKVIKGSGIGGRLGAHTANIETANELIPSDGVYITSSSILSSPSGNIITNIPSITSVGLNPTFHGRRFSVETHLIDFNGDLLNNVLAIDFLLKLRDQIAFPSAALLQQQIKKDIKKAGIWHEKNKTS